MVRRRWPTAIAVLLGYLGAHEERTRQEISRLAAWPRFVPQRVEPAVRALLEHAAGVIGAPHAVLAWVESEEPCMISPDRAGGSLQ